jgi:exopolysaccharide biosynthesis predicted pyruvyltransferase EpsI
MPDAAHAGRTIIVNNLREELSELIAKALVPLMEGHTSHICIIDPPGHANVGDSAILLGEFDFIARHFPNARVSYYDVESYSTGADRFIEQASILLLHGGGNFGDIWPYHHNFRLQILERFSHKKIIQFPQSISFSTDQEALRRTSDVIAMQRDFTLMVRDQTSEALAKQLFECDVVLAPDMAFAMNAIVRTAPAVDCLCLLRTDKEAVANHNDITEAIRCTGRSLDVRDWLDDRRTLATIFERRLIKLTRMNAALTAPLRSVTMQMRRAYAARRLEVGINILSRGRGVVADRLHAHILCCLLDIPQVFFDSYDGKISAFHTTWTKDKSRSWLATSQAELLAGLDQAIPL